MGIKTFRDILSNGNLKTWNALCDEFNISGSNYRTFSMIWETCNGAVLSTDMDEELDLTNDIIWCDGTNIVNVKEKTIYNITLLVVLLCWTI